MLLFHQASPDHVDVQLLLIDCRRQHLVGFVVIWVLNSEIIPAPKQ